MLTTYVLLPFNACHEVDFNQHCLLCDFHFYKRVLVVIISSRSFYEMQLYSKSILCNQYINLCKHKCHVCDCLVMFANTNICTPFMLFCSLLMFFYSSVLVVLSQLCSHQWESIYHICVRHMGLDRPEAVNKIYLLTYLLLLKLECYSGEHLLNQISSFCDHFTWQKSMIIVNFCFLVKLGWKWSRGNQHFIRYELE